MNAQNETTPVKVAILGAGPAGLATAYGLSATPELRAKYEVTVYQVGWRAGGKVTSGRQGVEQRLRQNGTHYLFGCYFNTFELARHAYQELNGQGDYSFGSFDDSFIPLSFLALKQRFRGEWHDWLVEIPTNRHEPGDHTSFPEPTAVFSMLLQWLTEAVAGWKLSRRLRPAPPFTSGYRESGWWERLATQVVDATVLDLLKLARRLVRKSGATEDVLNAVIWLLAQVRRGSRDLFGDRIETDLSTCRRWLLLDLGCSFITGLIRDSVFSPGGFGALDRYDYREWLRRHGASPMTLESPLVMGWYDSIASYEGGDASRPNVSAGATVYSLLYAGLGYKGAFAYQAKREIGETWAAPMYQALRNRGVKFRFFHRIWDLETKDGEIHRVKVEAQLPDADVTQYDPFITVKGRRAWPDEPLYARIGEETIGAARNADLEDFYTSWRGSDFHLERGKDFDTLVYTLPVGSIPYYCSRLVAEQPSWRKLVENVRGVDTRSLWLYFKPDLAGLGWPYPVPVLTGYASPFSTWEETTYLVDCETWPAGRAPGAICSLFGPMPGPVVAPGPENPGSYPETQRRQANRSALEFATRQVGDLWPGVANPGNPAGVDWDALVDLHDGLGEARFDFQGVRANFGPIQRYTLAHAGTLQYRLAPDESGYRNLYLAGDWTRNGTEIGCIEGAVKSGLMAAIAISGEGSYIGEDQHTGL